MIHTPGISVSIYVIILLFMLIDDKVTSFPYFSKPPEKQKREKRFAYSKYIIFLCTRKTGMFTKHIGSLDEWLSQRSAKPCTAVRIRQEPLIIENYFHDFISVPWMSGLVSGLQNHVRRFESARNLKKSS